MCKRCIVLLLSVFFFVPVVAQGRGYAQFELRQSSIDVYSFTFSVTDLDIIPYGDYAALFVDGSFSSLQEPGKPELPVFQQIVAVPQGAEPQLGFTIGETFFKHLGDRSLRPAQPHTFKNREADFAFDRSVYASDVFFAKPVVSIAEIGSMRGLRLLRITVSPFEYNPQKNTLAIHSDISIEITFSGADVPATVYELERHAGLPVLDVANRETFVSLLASSRQQPPKYVVVALDTFVTALQPFVEWKRRKGFNVVELYVHSGDTCTIIRNRLDSIYRASTPLDPAPAFVTIVGDVKHIPSFEGKVRISGLGRHFTDLYYAEYTGDFYPDMLYGRISVADTAGLSAVLSKTMDYEQCCFADTSFLNRVLLVAGRETRVPAPTVTNGQINYLNNTYFANNSNIDTHCFYNPASELQLPRIIDELNLGASLVNYTSHCLATGWHRPTYTSSGADTLDNFGKCFFAVNNCCLSSRFSDPCCFGEALLRRNSAGAVGVIGAANETLWEEDYYWALGAKGAVSLNPQYDSARLGAFDRFLHTHGEPYTQTAATAGEILQAGTFGLAQMGMTYENYYWEIYNLLGDPSLMPYLGVPQNITLRCPDSLPFGASKIVVHGMPHTRVAFWQDSILLSSVRLDANGDATAIFSQPLSLSPLVVVATAQFCKPFTDTISIYIQTAPNVVITDGFVSDTFGVGIVNQRVASGEAFDFDFVLLNAGSDTAKNVVLELQSLDGRCFVPTTLYNIGDMPAFDTVRTNGVFSFVPNPYLRENEIVSLKATVFTDSTATCERRFDFLIRSANIETGLVEILHNGIPATSLQKGGSYTLRLPACNIGSRFSDTINTVARMESRFGRVLLPDTIAILPLAPQASDTAEFVFSVNADAISYIDINIAIIYGDTVCELPLRLPLDKAEETFETGDFSLFSWDTTHPNAWFIDTIATLAYAGRYCARSANITHKQQSVLSITLTTIADDTISFYRRTSTEASSDYLSFAVDGVVKGKWAGSGQWERMAYFVPRGKHEFAWIYEKDASLDGGINCVWIDNITFPLSITDTTCLSEPTEGIFEVGQEKKCRVFPNPAKGYFVVENTGNEQFEVRINDCFGKNVDKMSILPSERSYYETAELRSGVYILIFTGKNDSFAEKIIISK